MTAAFQSAVSHFSEDRTHHGRRRFALSLHDWRRAIGMLDSPASPGRLWLTQIQYMNNSSEFYYAYRIAQQEIVALGAECPVARRVISRMWGIPHDLTGQLSPVKGTVFSRYYSFSLSEAPGLLSQWRGYAPEGGYCVGFRFGDLQRLANFQQLSLIKCIYDDEQTRAMIRDRVRAVEAGYNAGEIELVADNLRVIPEDQHGEATARGRLQAYINPLAQYLNHPSFMEEQEWRIVGIIGGLDERGNFRAKGGLIVAYAEIDISETGPSPLAAAEIIVGPGLDFNLSEQAIRMIGWPCYSQFPIKPSSSLFRR